MFTASGPVLELPGGLTDTYPLPSLPKLAEHFHPDGARTCIPPPGVS